MTVRTTRKVVTFTRPFSLSSIDKMQPAGTYTVETDEELLQDLSFPAYRRVATVILLPPRPGSSILGEAVAIDPAELEAARERDAMPEGPNATPASTGESLAADVTHVDLRD